MKRFFLGIWAGITAFFAWLVSSLAVCVRALRDRRGNKKRHTATCVAPYTRAVDDIEFLEPEPTHETWLQETEYLALYVFERHYSLVLVLTSTQDESIFRDLRVVVFPRGQNLGIECVTDGLKKVRIFGQKYILPLSPVSEFDEHSYAKRIVWKDNCAQNVARVTLWLGDKSRSFLPRDDASIFFPEKEAAA
jgi:hypothetical protein